MEKTLEKPSHAETIGVFKSEADLTKAVDALYQSGFERPSISVQGDSKHLKQRFGDQYISPRRLEENPRAPRTVPEMPEDYYWKIAFTFAIPMFIGIVICIVVVGGIQSDNLTLITAAIFGAFSGAIVGALLAGIVHYKHQYRALHQIEKGGFVLWVTTLDVSEAEKAKAIMNQFGAYDVHNW